MRVFAHRHHKILIMTFIALLALKSMRLIINSHLEVENIATHAKNNNMNHNGNFDGDANNSRVEVEINVVNNTMDNENNKEAKELHLNSRVEVEIDAGNITMDNEENKEAKELYLYLHVGPGKMATTTIQESLDRDKDVLNEDGYCVFGSFKFRKGVVPLLRHRDPTYIRGELIWDEFLSFLDQCHSLQQNVLLSSEGLGLLRPVIWNEVMKPVFSRWTFHVILGYRRYHEWAPSLYFEIYRQRVNAESIKCNIPTITEFLDDSRSLKLWTYSYSQHWETLVGYDLKFLIYNMHEDRNIMKTFYCKMLNSTKNACRKHNHNLPLMLNKRFSLDYHRLVIEGNNHYKLLPNTTDLNKAAKEMETIHKKEMGKTKTQFPRICLSDERLSKLLNVTFEMEEKLLPDWFLSENGEAAIKRDYKTFAGRELCSVDVTKVFKDQQYSNMWTAWRDHLGVKI